MYFIIKGLVQKGKENSRWLIFQDSLYYTTLIPNKRNPYIGQVISEKSAKEASEKQKKKEMVLVKVESLKEKGSIRESRWNVSFNGSRKTCLINKNLKLKKGDLVPICIGELSDK